METFGDFYVSLPHSSPVPKLYLDLIHAESAVAERECDETARNFIGAITALRSELEDAGHLCVPAVNTFMSSMDATAKLAQRGIDRRRSVRDL